MSPFRVNERSTLCVRLIIPAVLCLSLVWTAQIRNRVWESKITLWQDVVSKSFKKARAYNNLGEAYSRVTLHDFAIEQFLRSVQLDPRNPESRSNLGNEYRKRGQRDLAVQQYREAIRIDPRFASAYNNLGTIFFDSKMFAAAADYYMAAVRLNSGHSEFHYNLGRTHRAMGARGSRGS